MAREGSVAPDALIALALTVAAAGLALIAVGLTMTRLRQPTGRETPDRRSLATMRAVLAGATACPPGYHQRDGACAGECRTGFGGLSVGRVVVTPDQTTPPLELDSQPAAERDAARALVLAVWRVLGAVGGRLMAEHGRDLSTVPDVVLLDALVEQLAADGLDPDWLTRASTLAASRDLARMLAWAVRAAGADERGG
jgi:hypothetical protein